MQNAIDQGTAVAQAVAGKPVEYNPVPWFWSDQYETKLQSVGLPLGYDDVIARGTEVDGKSAYWRGFTNN